MRAASIRALRASGSIVVVAVVVTMLPFGELAGALRLAAPWTLALASAGFVLCHIAAAYKWRLLMGQSADLSVPQAVRAHFTGLLGNLSPLGMIGGDLLRTSVAIKGSSSPSAIMLSTVVDRVVDTGALMIIALTGFLWIGGRSTSASAVLLGGFAVSLAGIAVLVAAQMALKRTRDVRLTDARGALDLLLRDPGLIVRALGLSILIQGMFIASNAWLGASVGVKCSFAAWLLAWPAAKFAAYLPIAVAGIGVRETALVALLRPFGGAAGPVLAAAVLWDVVIIAGTLCGWLVTSGAAASPFSVPRGQRT